MIDAHCHLYDEKFDNIRQDVLEIIDTTDLYCITSGDNIATSRECISFAKTHPHVFATIGVHPHEAKSFKEGDIDVLRQMSREKGVVAIGEIGLDYHYDFSPREVQREVLSRQLELAISLSLPCVFHVREATKDFLDIMSTYASRLAPSLVHSFNGSIDTAKILLNYGFYLSFNGICTFNNARNILEIIDFMPLDRIILETDSPYLAPVPHRGEVNCPEYVRLVAEVVARIKHKSVEEIIRITQQNTERLFNIRLGERDG